MYTRLNLNFSPYFLLLCVLLSLNAFAALHQPYTSPTPALHQPYTSQKIQKIHKKPQKIKKKIQNWSKNPKIYWTSCLLPDSLGLGNTHNLSQLSNSWANIYANIRQCCVQQSNGCTVLCPILKILDNALSNCTMVEQCCVQQSNGWSMLCPTVRWLVS